MEEQIKDQQSESQDEYSPKKPGKIFFKYIILSVIVVTIIGFFLTFEGYKPKPPQDENQLSPEQLADIKLAGQDPENLKILGNANIKQTFDPTKLTIEDLRIGGGQQAKQGDTVEVNYEGKLLDGTMFDSSYLRKQTFSFTIGRGRVIEGWEKGLIGMKVGAKRKLIIPPDLGYGESGVPGTIPPNSVLVFEIELLNIK